MVHKAHLIKAKGPNEIAMQNVAVKFLKGVLKATKNMKTYKLVLLQ